MYKWNQDINLSVEEKRKRKSPPWRCAVHITGFCNEKDTDELKHLCKKHADMLREMCEKKMDAKDEIHKNFMGTLQGNRIA